MNKYLVLRALRDISDLYSRVILDSNFILNEQAVTWPRYEKGIHKTLVYAAEYQKLVDNRQFSFLLFDNSFFQFFYRWGSNGELLKAKLTFYPSPIKITGVLDELLEIAEASGLDLLEELYFGAEAWISRGIDVVNTSHIRLDYDSRVKSHSKCHMQIASINELRITSKFLLNPFNFFDWLVGNLNLESYRTINESQRYANVSRYHKPKNFEIENLDLSYPFLSA